MTLATWAKNPWLHTPPPDHMLRLTALFQKLDNHYMYMWTVLIDRLVYPLWDNNVGSSFNNYYYDLNYHLYYR